MEHVSLNKNMYYGSTSNNIDDFVEEKKRTWKLNCNLRRFCTELKWFVCPCPIEKVLQRSWESNRNGACHLPFNFFVFVSRTISFSFFKFYKKFVDAKFWSMILSSMCIFSFKWANSKWTRIKNTNHYYMRMRPYLRPSPNHYLALWLLTN